jgi:hypothetical protein
VPGKPSDKIVFDGSFFHYKEMHGTIYVKQCRGPQLEVWIAPHDVQDPNHTVSMAITKTPEYLTTPEPDAYVDFLAELSRSGLPPVRSYGTMVPNSKLRQQLERGAKPGPRVSVKVVIPMQPDVIAAVRKAGYNMRMHRDDFLNQEKPIVELPQSS